MGALGSPPYSGENAKMAHSSQIANQVSISAQLSISHGGAFTPGPSRVSVPMALEKKAGPDI